MFSAEITSICQLIIKACFLLLFFLTPLIFTPVNFELFEFNKMLAVYFLTAIIAAAWGIRMAAEQKVIFRRTFWDAPLLIFFAAMGLSTIFSRDIYMSIFGYYSRFHQGMLSITAFLILYWSFVSNIADSHGLKQRVYINTVLLAIVLSSLIVAAYGVAQHFGLDFFHWVQDVKFRIFSSMGQPNWLGAYLAIVMLIAFGAFLYLLPKNDSPKADNLKCKNQNVKLRLKTINHNSNGAMEQWSNGLFFPVCIFIYALLYTALLFTRSRSAFTAFHVCFLIFTAIILFGARRVGRASLRRIVKIFISIYLSFFISINVFNIFPTPIEKINGWTIPNIINKIRVETLHSPRPPCREAGYRFGEAGATSLQKKTPELNLQKSTEPGGTESLAIRQIVWYGAWNAFLANPILGTGLETFALAYYQYKPLEQNMVSEWDFLYNKAHNEYLNYLATTGTVGSAAYLILIGSFVFYFIKSFSEANPRVRALQLGLFLAWFTILITNLVGFSVVVISLFFYLIPAILFTLNENSNQSPQAVKQLNHASPRFTLYGLRFMIPFILTALLAFYALRFTLRWWLADYYFARQEYQAAIDLSFIHPAYHNELAVSLSELAQEYLKENKRGIAAGFAEKAIDNSDAAIGISPQNPVFYSYRALALHNLSSFDKKYEKQAIAAILKARELAPHDPKIMYHAAIYFLNDGQIKKSLKAFEIMEKLKPNYVEGIVSYAKVLYDIDDAKKAVKSLEELLKYYPKNPDIIKLIKTYRK